MRSTIVTQAKATMMLVFRMGEFLAVTSALGIYIGIVEYVYHKI